MSQLPLFYNADLISGENLISGELAHHIITVLRMKAGERIRISNGVQDFGDGEISEVGKKSLKVVIPEIHSLHKVTPTLCVIQAVPKSERVKESLELLVEAGVDEIYPWQAQRSIGKLATDGAEKWSNLVKAASSQARRVAIPTISRTLKFSDLVATVGNEDLLFICHESAEKKFSQVISDIAEITSYKKIFIAIGPEGGISDEEIHELSSVKNSFVLSLGENVFRSAHAGIAALSALQMAMGRW